MVTQNLTDGTVAAEPDLAFDPSYMDAHSSFTVVETVAEDGNKIKKAVGKMSKRCSCTDKDHCHHEWEVTDQGCGVVVKSNHKKYWAHKASFVGFPQSHVPIDAAAVNYAATNDGQTLIPHLKRLQQHVPLVTDKVDRVIADGPFNTKASDFPQIDWDHPQHLARWKNQYRKRIRRREKYV